MEVCDDELVAVNTAAEAFTTASTIVAVAGDRTIVPLAALARLRMNVWLAKPAVFNAAMGTEMVFDV